MLRAAAILQRMVSEWARWKTLLDVAQLALALLLIGLATMLSIC